MKLYTMPGACSLSDHIALEWIGKPFEVEVLTHDQTKQPDFLKINPVGAVPVLVEGDMTLTQNAAILNYLADVAPDSNLGGDGSPKSRAEVNRWLGFFNADVHPAFLPLFGASAYLKDDAAIEKTKDAAKKNLRSLFERADQQLAGKEWITGTRSIADPYLFVVMQWAKTFNVDLSGFGNLAAFDKRMAADAGVQRAQRSEGLI